MIALHPLTGLPEIEPGDDLADILGTALACLPKGRHPVLVVTQKIVSKAEGLFVDLREVSPDEEARALAAKVHKDPRLVALILKYSTEIIRAAPHILITRHLSGHVMANAGIDQSNLGPGEGERVLLLPPDPDASAQQLFEALGIPVVISDSFGRPWRIGVTGVAIGAAGLPALEDRRGMQDRDGRRLQVTQIANADALAAAAQLVMGETIEGIPAALITGFTASGPHIGAGAIVRPLNEDLFR